MQDLRRRICIILGKYDYNFKPGDLVKGTVFALEPKGAMIDIGAKTAAFMPVQEVSINRVEASVMFCNPQKVEFFIMSEENEDGQLALSIRRIEYQRDGKELGNCKRKMPLYTQRYSLPIEVGHL